MQTLECLAGLAGPAECMRVHSFDMWLKIKANAGGVHANADCPLQQEGNPPC